jgi:chromosomal replication initiation ATPase DnaA
VSGPGIASARPSSAQVILNLHARGFLEVVEALCRANRIDVEGVCGRDRHMSVVRVRHAVWTALRDHGLSTPEIGRLFGVDHTTVLYGTRSPKRVDQRTRTWARQREAKAS